MKICSKCRQHRTLDMFHNDASRHDGKFPQCKICTASADRLRRVENITECRARDRRYYVTNLQKRKLYLKSNAAKISNYVRAYRVKHSHALKIAALDYQKRNPELFAYHSAARRARTLHATPIWANHTKIREFYDLAKLLTMASGGIPYHVDHIVPLKHPLVCGLHCEQNLQVLPMDENITKGNRYWPDMPT